MATFVKTILSGSTDGKGVKVATTATAGTTIHTAHATSIDEIWLLAHNSSVDGVTLTIEFGGTVSPDNTIEVDIPPEDGLALLVAGLPITNSVVVRAFAAVANVVVVYGYVNRIT